MVNLSRPLLAWRRVPFSTHTGLVTEPLECKGDRTPRQIAQAARAPTPGGPGVTGCVTFSQAGAELLFQVVGRAHEPHSFMVTTNLPLESRAEVLGSEPLTGALVDRPTHRVYIIEATYEGN